MQRAEKRELAREMAKEFVRGAQGSAQPVPRPQGMAVETTAKSTIYPFAEDLEAYNRAIPNGAERLFDNFEGQTQHRISLENRVVDSNIRQAERGQVMGFITLVLALGTAVWAAHLGYEKLGITVVVVVLAGGFSAFITSKVQQYRDLRRKRQAAQQAGTE